jgi:hypothetical protein
MAKTAAAPHPPFDLAVMGQRFAQGDLESLVAFYADRAEVELDGPGARRRLTGPIGIREGLERIAAAGLKHELRLAAVGYTGAHVIDRCRDPRTGKTVAWGALRVSRGLIVHHSIRWDARS